MNPKLTLIFPEYARFLPLALGDVKPDGVDLVWKRGPRTKTLPQALTDPAMDGGEHSLSQHLYRTAAGDRAHVGVPIFPLRNFGARDFYVRGDSAITSAADLAGKRVGMYSWTASGSVWYRHLLRHLGVSVASIRWTIGPIDDPAPATPPPNLHGGAVAAPPGKVISTMLREGELDAIISPLRPAGFDLLKGPLKRLFADFAAVEMGYQKATGCYPIQHLVILRRAVVDRAPWVMQRLVDCFVAAEKHFVDNMWMFPYASPWLEADLERVERTMGLGYHGHGLEPNRRQLEAFCAEAHASGLTQRVIGVDELFADYLAAAKAPARAG